MYTVYKAIRGENDSLWTRRGKKHIKAHQNSTSKKSI